MSPVDTSQLDAIIAAANKRFKDTSPIHTGDQTQPVYRIPWDSLEMNLATYGGAPMGRIIRLWGGYSSGKTLNLWGLAKQAQQHRSERFPDGLIVAYYNVEGTYDPVFTRDMMGVDIEKLVIVEGTLIEDISTKLDALLHAAHIHIIDSVSMAQSVHSFTASKESRQPGLDAVAWKNALRSAEENMDKQENMIAIVQHAVVDFKTTALKPQGGSMANFANAMSLKHRQATKLYRTEGGDWTDKRPQKGNDDLTGTHKVDGYEIEIEVDKSKVCRPFGKARLRLDLDTISYDKMFELKKAGLFLGVIEQSGSFFRVPTSDKSIQGQAKLEERLAQDDALVMEIYRAAGKYMTDKVYA